MDDGLPNMMAGYLPPHPGASELAADDSDDGYVDEHDPFGGFSKLETLRERHQPAINFDQSLNQVIRHHKVRAGDADAAELRNRAIAEFRLTHSLGDEPSDEDDDHKPSPWAPVASYDTDDGRSYSAATDSAPKAASGFVVVAKRPRVDQGQVTRGKALIRIGVEVREAVSRGDRVRIGALLKSAKETAGHGAFLPWLKQLGMSPRTAQHYMGFAP